MVVLARYMQIVSGEFLQRVGVPLINIHHHASLPAFAGTDGTSGPITAHDVTEELDAGPDIEQGVIRVTHRDDVATFTGRGADIERIVLARAVEWHC